jgi:hypothetical protein
MGCEGKLKTFFTLAADGRDWSASLPDQCLSDKTAYQYTLDRRPGKPQSYSGL